MHDSIAIALLIPRVDTGTIWIMEMWRSETMLSYLYTSVKIFILGL